MEIIQETPKPKYLIVDSSNFDVAITEILKQKPMFKSYCDKDKEKHPTLNKWKVTMLPIPDLNWEEVISKITCEQVVELSSDWKPVLPNKV